MLHTGPPQYGIWIVLWCCSWPEFQVGDWEGNVVCRCNLTPLGDVVLLLESEAWFSRPPRGFKNGFGWYNRWNRLCSPFQLSNEGVLRIRTFTGPLVVFLMKLSFLKRNFISYNFNLMPRAFCEYKTTDQIAKKAFEGLT